MRRRFHLDDDELARIEEWVTGTGVRWGLDAAHRRPFELDALDANTWRSGIDRLLLGVAMTEDDHPLVGGVLPLDDVDSGDIVLAGRLAELVERLRIVVADMGASRTIAGWATSLTAAADALLRRAGRRRRGSGPSSIACWWTSSPSRPPHRGSRSGSPSCGRCSPTGCGAGRAGSTSAPDR